MLPRFEQHDTVCEARADGSILYRARQPLGEVVDRTTDWLDHWAEAAPDATFLAERSGAGWRALSYLEARQQARALAGGLLSIGLEPGDTILILSGNSVDHAILVLAAQYVGLPIVPLAEQYALIPGARGQIDHAASVVRPAAVFAEDGGALAEVLSRPVFDGVQKVVSRGADGAMHVLSDLQKVGGDIGAAHAQVGPDTMAKILMTSGSTSAPKGVPTTQRMMCANQTMIAQGLPFLKDRPPVIVDWLPWNHVFGGSHNFNMMLANGGALYIDAGKPVPHLIGQTLENMRLKTGTITFNVPAGFAMIRDALQADTGLRRAYFEELDMLFYAGASLPQDVWADLEGMAREVRGDMPLFTSSWGLTETAPATLLQHEPTDRSGVVGVPLPGIEVKLLPDADGRCEARVRGPNVFGGYLNHSEAGSFDDEGFFLTGDAMVWVDPGDPNKGLRFDGRISESFKLLSGTWVRAAALRLQVLEALGGIVADVVITGADRSQVGVLLIPSAATRAASDATEDEGALIVPSLDEQVREALGGLGGSSSTRVTRAMFLSEPPSIGDGEMTAKGNINFRKLLARRESLLDRLYNEAASGVVRP